MVFCYRGWGTKIEENIVLKGKYWHSWGTSIKNKGSLGSSFKKTSFETATYSTNCSVKLHHFWAVSKARDKLVMEGSAGKKKKRTHMLHLDNKWRVGGQVCACVLEARKKGQESK